jgi:hypothetical protein
MDPRLWAIYARAGEGVREYARLLAFPFRILGIPPPSNHTLPNYRHVRLASIIAHLKRSLDASGRHSETHQGSHGMCYVQKTQDQGVSDTLSRHARNLSIHHEFISFCSVVKSIRRVGTASSMELVATSPS